MSSLLFTISERNISNREDRCYQFCFFAVTLYLFNILYILCSLTLLYSKKAKMTLTLWNQNRKPWGENGLKWKKSWRVGFVFNSVAFYRRYSERCFSFSFQEKVVFFVLIIFLLWDDTDSFLSLFLCLSSKEEGSIWSSILQIASTFGLFLAFLTVHLQADWNCILPGG